MMKLLCLCNAYAEVNIFFKNRRIETKITKITSVRFKLKPIKDNYSSETNLRRYELE